MVTKDKMIFMIYLIVSTVFEWERKIVSRLRTEIGRGDKRRRKKVIWVSKANL
jgi:hypothetical protein